MKTIKAAFGLLTITLAVGIATPGQAGAATIRVPQDQATITGAVAAANDGDSVFVSAGTYNETNIQITKNISISSLTGPTNTIVECSHLGRGFIITGATLTNVSIVGLTIQNGLIPEGDRGGAVFVLSGKCKISRCIIQGTTGPADYSSGPINDEYVQDNPGANINDLTVENCIVRNNFAANGAGITFATVYNCWVYGNTGGNCCEALAGCNATNCTVYGNGGGFLSNPWTVGGVAGGNLENCIVWNNLLGLRRIDGQRIGQIVYDQVHQRIICQKPSEIRRNLQTRGGPELAQQRQVC